MGVPVEAGGVHRRLPRRCGAVARAFDLEVAARVFLVIGGVAGYATDMVDFYLPAPTDDVDRWIVRRVLSPAATLQREAANLLAENRALAGTDPALPHSILGVMASGSVTAGKTPAGSVGRSPIWRPRSIGSSMPAS